MTRSRRVVLFMIVPALDRALGAFGPSDGERVRRIIFLTDGAVGNEAQLLSRMTADLDGIRLHAIGIGPAPNRYVMRKMASVGRGTYGFVAEVGEADESAI